MGICSQDMIFFPELTGAQHVWFWCTFKNVYLPTKEFDVFVTEVLAQVGLEDAADVLVRRYSGGMQRKLQVALASIGDPSVVLLDEPTTGLDPISRRHVWDFILRLKKDRVVLLTTHSMEEADALSDTVTLGTGGTLTEYVGTSG